ncbi:6-O-methylguanine DNA methyltransferase [Rhodotorula diobovata]|uniref:Methylated-DNA--protein-cysteine methyltransferase n=1 Tax=Rhodotorula diobovata TaxID=5288 RepID=A0A5C5G885_9BASI|nr:6-O-methylguanine DNA methyltransferase [Rhodotorula diobovata]
MPRVTLLTAPAVATSESPSPSSPTPYPRTPADRSSFRRRPGTKCSPFQWRLYDLVLSIPPGCVATYGHLATLLDSSPRAVGSALRNNPFAPFVPCHRVIASSLYVGGFGGEWLKPGAARSSQSGSARRAGEGHHKEGERTADKVELLRREGVDFDERGYLRDKGKLWNGEKRADGDAAAGTRAKAAGRTAGGG